MKSLLISRNTMAATVRTVAAQAASGPATNHASPITTAPVHEHVCLFTHDLRRKQKRWADGRLKYHTYNRRVMVYDDRGNFIGDTHWRDEYGLSDGDEVELERGGVIVQVGECVGSRDQDLSELVDKRAEEKAQRQAAAAAAAASRQPSAAVATAAAVAGPPTPHVARPQPLPSKHIHDVIGTPSGHHGRALIPKESPYEQRQRAQTTPQSESTRPTKRQRRDRTPPRKSGYAQNLFGATLTLSGCPSSQASSRLPSTKVARDKLDLSSPSLPIHSAHGNALTLGKQAESKQTAPAASPNCSDNPFVQARRSQPPSKLSTKLRAAQRSDRPHPVSRSGELQKVKSTKQQRSGAETGTVNDNTGGVISTRVSADVSLPVLGGASGKVDGPARDRHPMQIIAQELTRERRTGKGIANGKRDTLGRATGGSDLVDLTLGPDEDCPRNFGEGEAKTELRIKPRKKRGLLVVSEQNTAQDSSNRLERSGAGTSMKPPSRLPSRQSPGLGCTDDTGDETAHRMDSKVSNIEAQLTGSSRQPRKTKSIEKDPSNDKGDNNGRSLRPRIPSPDMNLDSDEIDKSGDGAGSGIGEAESSIEDMPPPRLARLGRKSIRSREVIGFVFDEELEAAKSTMPTAECRPEQATPKKAHETRVAADECVVVPSAEPRRTSEPQMTGLEAQRGPNAMREQDSEASQSILETTITMPAAKEVPVRRVPNPATRGRKAAKPADAAGQTPTCPLPKEAKTNVAMQQDVKSRSAMGTAQGQKGAEQVPGFSRANGGPWSREAYDLFEFKRPS
ncbi:hypothetical protein F5Y17DRAFT_424842 [Xylariaceae sp. FL0594]|nr:hypothetical protein F5Y17DRAFT_424842 [Xylariaceae sp. FL0594]